MTIWMDMTNSLVTWKGGITGIIRVELEIARTLKMHNKDIRVSVYNGTEFCDVTDEMDWLFFKDNYMDYYVNRFKEDADGTEAKSTDDVSNKIPTELVEATNFATSRFVRLKEAYRLWCMSMPNFIGKGIWNLSKVFLNLGFSVCLQKEKIKRRFSYKRKEKKSVKSVPSAVFSKKNNSPYEDGDVVFSCGWYRSGKEQAFEKLKKELSNLKLMYLVYDLVLVKPETACFYYEKEDFTEYLHWVSKNCNHVFYWGETAQKDTEDLFKEKKWHKPYGSPAYCCAEMKSSKNYEKHEEEKILHDLGVSDKYIMMVGSIEPKKNYDVIYRAYKIMSAKYNKKEIPQCVIVGGNFGSCKNLVNCFKTDPEVKDKFLFIKAKDDELNILYKYAMFTMVPSFYEGWSIVLAEMLSYKKLCLASDVGPLRDVTKDLAVFINPLDAKAWAEKIYFYATHNDELKKIEKKIAQEWNPPQWDDMAEHILGTIENLSKNIYFDFTIPYRYSFVDQPQLSGIPRAIILLAKYMYTLVPNIKYFALTEAGYISIDYEDISNIIEGELVDTDFKNDSLKLRNKPILIQRIVANDTEEKDVDVKEKYRMQAKWLWVSILSKKKQARFVEKISTSDKDEEDGKTGLFDGGQIDLPFEKDDLIVSVGPGYSEWESKCFIDEKKKKGFKLIQTIYDLTPILVPQTHNKDTLRAFNDEFLKYVFDVSDYMFYGGETAKRDSEQYAVMQGHIPPKGYVIKWGNDIKQKGTTEQRVKEILCYYGITKPFILTVGTVQRRKNQEILYHAILTLLEKKSAPNFQLVIAGYPGWGYDEFLKTVKNDARVKDRIIFITPTDEELNVLYLKCLFTVLPSLYEGWSLTLPESLQYGKFCIASDSDPLKEIGKDLIDYANPYDAVEWAEKISFYVKNPSQIAKREKKIKNSWKGITWFECAEQIVDAINDINDERRGSK